MRTTFHHLLQGSEPRWHWVPPLIQHVQIISAEDQPASQMDAELVNLWNCWEIYRVLLGYYFPHPFSKQSGKGGRCCNLRLSILPSPKPWFFFFYPSASYMPPSGIFLERMWAFCHLTSNSWESFRNLDHETSGYSCCWLLKTQLGTDKFLLQDANEREAP